MTKKRSRDPAGSSWKEIVDSIMESKTDIRIEKLLRRGVKRMRDADSRSEVVLKEELNNVLQTGQLPGYALNESLKRVVRQKEGGTLEEGEENIERGDDNHKQEKVGTAGFDIPDRTWRESLQRTDVKTGKFSKSEESTLRQAVITYAKDNGLSTDDYSWIIGKKEYNGERGLAIRGIWAHVAKSLPRRTIKSVAAAGVRIFHPYANKGAWSSDDDESLRAMVNSLGTQWTKISNTIQRTPEACRLRWREIRSEESRSGTWGKDEEERLVEAVEKFGKPRSLKGNSTVQKIDDMGNIVVPERRMILDDINWESVVAYVKTRSRIQCVTKWYLRLGPTMQDRGEWDKPDDKILLKALWNEREKNNNVMEHEVSWDALVPGRSADQCKRRWALMRKLVKSQKDYEFAELIWELVLMLLPKLIGLCPD